MVLDWDLPVLLQANKLEDDGFRLEAEALLRMAFGQDPRPEYGTNLLQNLFRQGKVEEMRRFVSELPKGGSEDLLRITSQHMLGELALVIAHRCNPSDSYREEITNYQEASLQELAELNDLLGQNTSEYTTYPWVPYIEPIDRFYPLDQLRKSLESDLQSVEKLAVSREIIAESALAKDRADFLWILLSNQKYSEAIEFSKSWIKESPNDVVSSVVIVRNLLWSKLFLAASEILILVPTRTLEVVPQLGSFSKSLRPFAWTRHFGLKEDRPLTIRRSARRKG
jgi:hypothetical protein